MTGQTGQLLNGQTGQPIQTGQLLTGKTAQPAYVCREPACTKSICPVKLYKKSSSFPFALRLSVRADRFSVAKNSKFAKNA